MTQVSKYVLKMLRFDGDRTGERVIEEGMERGGKEQRRTRLAREDTGEGKKGKSINRGDG